MAVVSYLNQMRIQHSLLFFNHGTKTSADALKFLTDRYGEQVLVGNISNPAKPKDESWEEYWRNERNKFFKSRKAFIITGHHLDDAVETYLWSSLHGTAKTPLYYNGLVYRPFLLNRKQALINWAERRKVEWIEDKTNADVKYTRNFVRAQLLPMALKVNPGLHKVVKKKILTQFSEATNG